MGNEDLNMLGNKQRRIQNFKITTSTKLEYEPTPLPFFQLETKVCPVGFKLNVRRGGSTIHVMGSVEPHLIDINNLILYPVI